MTDHEVFGRVLKGRAVVCVYSARRQDKSLNFSLCSGFIRLWRKETRLFIYFIGFPYTSSSSKCFSWANGRRQEIVVRLFPDKLIFFSLGIDLTKVSAKNSSILQFFILISSRFRKMHIVLTGGNLTIVSCAIVRHRIVASTSLGKCVNKCLNAYILQCSKKLFSILLLFCCILRFFF